MKIPFDDIVSGFHFVSSGPPSEIRAILATDNGRVYFESAMGDSDELPDDMDDSQQYVEIPHKNELDLGAALVMRFSVERMPENVDEVRQIFSRKGAYARFRTFLEDHGKLDEWYQYEDLQTKTALKAWCAENQIELAE
jgi:hypothetical protein